MLEDEKAYRELFAELSQFEKCGIHMCMDGETASPLQIATAHMAREQVSYMRDYIWNDEGKVEELRFNKVKYVN